MVIYRKQIVLFSFLSSIIIFLGLYGVYYNMNKSIPSPDKAFFSYRMSSETLEVEVIGLSLAVDKKGITNDLASVYHRINKKFEKVREFVKVQLESLPPKDSP